MPPSAPANPKSPPSPPKKTTMEKLKPTTPHPPKSKADFSPRGASAPPSRLTEPLSRARSKRRAWPVRKTMRLPVGVRRIFVVWHPVFAPAGSKPAGNEVTGSAQSSTTRSLRSRLVAVLKVMDLQTCLRESKRLDPPPPTAQHGNRQPPIALRARKSAIAALAS